MKTIRTFFWNRGYNILPLPRFVRRVLWRCGVDCCTCPHVVRDCGNHDTFALNCEHIDEHTPDSGEVFIL